MILSLQVQWSWIRTSREQWLCTGLPLQMRRGMIDYTTWYPRETPSNALGGQCQTTSSTTSSQLSTFCLEGSITSEYLLKMTWVFHHLLNLLCLKPNRKKVRSSMLITFESTLPLTKSQFLCQHRWLLSRIIFLSNLPFRYILNWEWLLPLNVANAVRFSQYNNSLRKYHGFTVLHNYY